MDHDTSYVDSSVVVHYRRSSVVFERDAVVSSLVSRLIDSHSSLKTVLKLLDSHGIDPWIQC